MRHIHSPSVGDSLRRRDVTQWLKIRQYPDSLKESLHVVSSDTDSIVFILRYMTTYINMGLQEVLVEFDGEHKRKIPLHTLHARFGAAFCSILVKVNVLPGNDAVSKVGTKHAALTCNPLSLTNFAKTDSLTTVDISVVERYRVKVLTEARSNTTAVTFDKFRHDSYLNGKALTDLPPTSSAIVSYMWSH